MIDSTPPLSQNNFPSGNIPAGTGDFYNSAKFASNLLHFLSSVISADEKSQKEANQELQKAGSGQD